MGFEQYKKGDTFPIEIHQVVEGDVLEVRVLGTADFSEQNTESIRLYGIDAPELTQKYGIEAKSYLERLTRHGRFWMRVMDIREDDFIVGDVYRNSPNESLSQDMVRAGWAYWRRNDGDDGIGLHDLEQRAFFNAMGVWQDGGDEIRPWDYRRIVQEEEEERRRIAREEEEDLVSKYNDYNRGKDRIATLWILFLCAVSVAILLIFEFSSGLPYRLGYLSFMFLIQVAEVSIGFLILYSISSTKARLIVACILFTAFMAYEIYTPNRVLGNYDIILALGVMYAIYIIVGLISQRVDWSEWKVIEDNRNLTERASIE